MLTELQNARDPGEELGDLLFSCVNVARLSGIDPEQALKNATEKFIKRFSAMENLIKLDEKSLRDLTLSEMDVYWNRVKAAQIALLSHLPPQIGSADRDAMPQQRAAKVIPFHLCVNRANKEEYIP